MGNYETNCEGIVVIQRRPKRVYAAINITGSLDIIRELVRIT